MCLLIKSDMEIIDKLTAILNRLESLKQLQDADINYLEEQIDQIEYDDLPQLKDEINKSIDYSDNNPDYNLIVKEQIEDLFDKIDEAIYSVRIQFGLNDYKEDDEQIEYVDGGEYEQPESDVYSIVLKEVARSALKTIGFNNKDNNAVSVMETILVGILSKDDDDLITTKAFSELTLSGVVPDREEIMEMSKNTREKCQLQLLGLQLAIDSIREYNCGAFEVLSQISVFL